MTPPESPTHSRRRFFHDVGTAVTAAALAGATGFSQPAAAAPKRRPKVAAIFTTFFLRSHAHVILENFLEPYYFNGKRTDAGCDVVSFFPDQIPGSDMARATARTYGIPVYNSIEEALCLGGKELAVDAVLSIAEHGSYPATKLGQRMYPHKRFFDESVAVMKRSGRFVPLFNDKHLSHSWVEAKAIHDVAQKHGIPLMAGSSVPLAQRRPPLEIPPGVEFDDALVIHGGPAEAYDFHGFELLQSMIESRKGGETGVSSIEFLRGDAVKRAGQDGRWSMELAEAAMGAELGKTQSPFVPVKGESPIEPSCALITYKDGLKATVLKTSSYSDIRWNFACRLRGDSTPRATYFYGGPWHNRNLFKALSHAIQHFFIHGEAPYPAERTLLVSGMLDASMQSRHDSGKVVRTPHLEFPYKAKNFRAMREMGASWKIITEEIPPTLGIDSANLHPLPKKK